MIITNPYDVKQGLMIISPNGSQRYTEGLDSYSQILTSLYVSNYNDNNKFCIDSCWESGNIYYANYNEGYVKKIQYDGTELASLSLTNPCMVSVIQNSNTMNTNITYPPQDDQGCWIVDKGTNTVIKTDKDLNIIHTSIVINNLVGIASDINGGCYVASNTTIYKLSSTAAYVGSYSPTVTRFIDMKVDLNGLIWFCADDKLYQLEWNGTAFQQNFVINPFVGDGSSSSSTSSETQEEEMHLAAIDVDRNTLAKIGNVYIEQFLYVSGGNSYRSFILKYDKSGYLKKHQEYDMGFPYVLKVIQGMGSDSIYVLGDSGKWDNYGYGSSSSSSSSSSTSYIENWSSSSSSTEIKSSSSSSSL